MAGLVPAIYGFDATFWSADARNRRGQDGGHPHSLPAPLLTSL